MVGSARTGPAGADKAAVCTRNEDTPSCVAGAPLGGVAGAREEALWDIRLEQLNARLVNAGAGERVIDIAFDLGFTHLGRMASHYRAKFGESPSATLRKSR